MTFCTAHRQYRQPADHGTTFPLPRAERRNVRAGAARRVPGQIFTDWASI